MTREVDYVELLSTIPVPYSATRVNGVSSGNIALVVDYDLRLVYIGADLAVPFERIAHMTFAPPAVAARAA